MQSFTIDAAVRHDAVMYFDVTDGNPNGDPDGGNRPRVDEETGHGLVTDVSIKRKIRDTIGLAAASSGLDPARYRIFVEAGHALNDRTAESYEALNLKLNAKSLTAAEGEAARRWLTERYVDIRLFGAVLSTGETKALGQIRGPLQLGMARSIDPVLPVSHAITRVTQTRRKDIDDGQSTEMGSKWTVPYGLYRLQFHYSASRGRQTGVTSDDLTALYRTVLVMFDHDRAATRGILALRGLYIFSHADAFGSAPAQSLIDRVHAQRLSDPARSFADYKLVADSDDLPDGVSFEALHG
jgi:CRISPR-associated protein Csd2